MNRRPEEPSFPARVATFDPFNAHFIHDIGTFQIGIGSMLVLAATMSDGLYAALAGATIVRARSARQAS